MAISEDSQGGASVDVRQFTRHFNGIAHVVLLDPGASWSITQAWGKERSTFLGAIRCYGANFNLTSDPYKEKLWLREGIRRAEAVEADGFLNLCLRHVFAETTAQFAPYSLLTPSAVRRQIAVPAVAKDSAAVLPSGPITESERSSQPLAQAAASLNEALEHNASQSETTAVDSATEAFDAQQLLRQEIVRLEEQLVQAQDETAQKNRELSRIAPFERKVVELEEELQLLRGEFEDKSSPTLANFWTGFNLFFESTQTLAAQFQRTLKENTAIKTDLEHERDAVQKLVQKESDARQRLFAKERQIATLQDAPKTGAKPEVRLYPNDWEQFRSSAVAVFTLLTISTEVQDQVESTPFQLSLARGISDLLSILNDLAKETLQDGSLSPSGMLIKNQHFAGANTAFSDESVTNKRSFESRLTFTDPDDESKRLFCPWHGKLSQQNFRVHFEWPRPEGQRKIKVVYIGPKITKQ